ncbi:MAG: IPTL-CTERM sorting domain-containing protein [Candidatus Dadabacteria bacterium]|nr:IPTL-CTERM sorting domain-containing protein [Candidatus Dadabacteria bacterium]
MRWRRGASSFIDGVDNGTTTSGVREGDGLVVLSWTVVLPEPIPTLSEWGLIAMAGILGIVGFMVMRRRKVSA